MKKFFFFTALLAAIIPALAFIPLLDGIPAYYQSGASCLSGITNETDCSTNNSGAQCTVNVSGNPPAFNNSTDCSGALRLK